jgi:hypothetical protein
MNWDWDNAPRNNRAQLRRVLELLEEYWRVMAPSGRVIVCSSYRVDGPGVEVRAGYSPRDCHRTQRVADATHARVVAEMWRASLVSKGLTELPVRRPPGR